MKGGENKMLELHDYIIILTIPAVIIAIQMSVIAIVSTLKRKFRENVSKDIERIASDETFNDLI